MDCRRGGAVLVLLASENNNVSGSLMAEAGMGSGVIAVGSSPLQKYIIIVSSGMKSVLIERKCSYNYITFKNK